MNDPKDLVDRLEELKRLEKEYSNPKPTNSNKKGPKVHLDPQKQGFYDELTQVTK